MLAGAGGSAVVARATVTFAAYKPGLLLGDGPAHTGVVEVVDIGLGAGVQQRADCWLVEDSDVVSLLAARPATPTSGSRRWRWRPVRRG